jgi:hypothetical protein
VMALFLLTVSLGNYLTSAVKFFLSESSGSSLIHGKNEFWFWTILMIIGATIFIFVSRNYKARDQLHVTLG